LTSISRARSFEVLAGGPFLPNVKGIHQRMEQCEPIVFGNFLRDKQGFTRDGIDGFMGFDFSETRVLVSRVAKAAHEEPFERVALQFEIVRRFPATRLSVIS